MWTIYGPNINLFSMLSKKSSKSNLLRKSSCGQLDTTGQDSHTLTEDSSAVVESILMQEALPLEDLDGNRQLLFTNTILLGMSQITSAENAQEHLFTKFKKDL
jgi:hypothetical protein